MGKKKKDKNKGKDTPTNTNNTKESIVNIPSKNPPQTGTVKPHVPCHRGNTLLSVSNLNPEGKLYAGGWLRSADPSGCYVVDLTGNEYNKKHEQVEVYDDESLDAFQSVLASMDRKNVKGWLSFPMPDFGVPDYDLEVWMALAKDILALMERGESVLLSCAGGHGRTGVAAAIICYILTPDKSVMKDNPVEWIRNVHCKEAVETIGQVDYVFDILGLIGLPDTHKLTTKAAKPEWQSSYSNKGWYASPETKVTTEFVKNAKEDKPIVKTWEEWKESQADKYLSDW